MADYQQLGLFVHNQYRKRHGAPKVVLTDRLNQIADAYAYKLASRRMLQHSSGMDYGENLYMTTDTSKSKKQQVKNACDAWYGEKQYYNYSRGGFSMQTGHFTATVWKETTQLGIGCAEANGRVVVVANYKVHPNMMGEFGSNVLPYRKVEDSDDEDEKRKKAAVAEKKKKDEEEAKRQKEEQEAKEKVPEEPAPGEDLPASVLEALASKADADNTIGWNELADLLNDHIKVAFKFGGFDKTISSLLIEMVTLRSGIQSRVNLAF